MRHPPHRFLPRARARVRRRAPRVLLAGGGTGGHLFPGLAVASALCRRAPGAALLLLGTGRPVEARALATTRIRHAVGPALRLPRGLGQLLALPWTAARALGHAASQVRAFDPDLVLGLGSYASLAPALVAAGLGRPLVLLEQNAVPGRATRLLAPLARRVFVPWEETVRALGPRSRRRCAVLGNPIRPELARPRPEARRLLGLSPHARVLLVLGGSQGARPLNRALWQAAPMLAAAARRSGRPFELVHLAGDADAAPLAARYRACGLRAFVSPWLADMNAAYRAADLALCRAGGSTIAELLACALPAVLVPLPHAAGDHQRANALAAARRGAAWALEERELQRPAVLRAIVALLADPERLEPMRRAAAAAACIEAADRIAACILEETECR